MSIYIILLLFFSNISIAKSENLYTLLTENKDLINQNLVTVKEEYPVLFYLIENRHVAIHTPDGQVVGLILSNGEIAQIIQGEPDDTTVDIYVELGTIENIKTPDDFLNAWREARIKVIFRNPIVDNPVASGAALAGSVFAFGFFYYFTGNYYKTKKSLFSAFSMLGMVKRRGGAYVEWEIATERMLFSILGWEGKGYKPKNNYARLLIGHSYLLNCRFTPLKGFKQAKIKLRYDDAKLRIDNSEHNVEMPETKIYSISTKTEGLPEMQTEATDFILFCAEWADGLKEEGLIKIPVVINRNIFDGVSYTIGNAIKWLGEIAAAIVIIASAINPLINFIIQHLL